MFDEQEYLPTLHPQDRHPERRTLQQISTAHHTEPVLAPVFLLLAVQLPPISRLAKVKAELDGVKAENAKIKAELGEVRAENAEIKSEVSGVKAKLSWVG
jgi:type II secretory pathway component PulM